MKFLIVFSALFFAFTDPVLALKKVSTQWQISEGSRVDIKAKYTFGTHELSSDQVTGIIYESDKNYSGQIIVPIKSIKEGNKELECHLQESLGLNYNNSAFPKKHVCDDQDQLPEAGPNKIEYSDIRFDINNIEKNTDKIFVTGKWTLHGISKTEKIEFLVLEENLNLLKIQSDVKFNLTDYEIIVKKAFVVSVNNIIDVKLNLVLKK